MTEKKKRGRPKKKVEKKEETAMDHFNNLLNVDNPIKESDSKNLFGNNL